MEIKMEIYFDEETTTKNANEILSELESSLEKADRLEYVDGYVIRKQVGL